jgi:hypothetical protein
MILTRRFVPTPGPRQRLDLTHEQPETLVSFRHSVKVEQQVPELRARDGWDVVVRLLLLAFRGALPQRGSAR